MAKQLPAGVTQKDFDDALNEFRKAVGTEWVFSDEDVQLYADEFTNPYRFSDKDPLPTAAVAPKTVEEVQKVVRICNLYKIPLWVISTGKTKGYLGGGHGMITVDLRRMNRVLEINEKHAYVVVEPGVNFYELYAAIEKQGASLWMDCPTPAWGSVLANTIQRGAGYTSMSDRWQFVCGMEVVLPNGDLLRTGMGAVPEARTWHTTQYGNGANLDGLFSRTNFGIVTKIGLWLLPEPPAYRVARVMVPNYEDLEPLIDIMRPMRQTGIIDTMATIRSGVYELGHKIETSNLFKPGMSESERKQMQKENGIGWWHNEFAFYGLPEEVNAKWEHVKARYSAGIPGVSFHELYYETPLRDPHNLPYEAKKHGCIPSFDAWLPLASGDRSRKELPPGGAVGGGALSTLFEGAEIMRLFDFMQDFYKRHNSPRPYNTDRVDIMARGPRELLVTAGGAPFNPKDIEGSIILAQRLMRELAANGFPASGGSPHTADAIMESHSFNNNALRRFNETLADALDPNGIMFPGKNGIWPKSMRERRS